MSWYGGAPLKDAFNIIGECSKKTRKEKDRDNPRDIEPNKLNHVNFENNMKWLLERYDNIIHKLQKEVNELKTNNNNIIEGFKNKQNNQSNYNTFLSEQQINQIIFFIFASVLLILALNYIFELCG
jgi:hypothetical protein